LKNGIKSAGEINDSMRTFLQSRAEASFLSGGPFTFVIHKDYWEYVFKLKQGYCVINAFVSSERLVTLFASWGDYFKPMQNVAAPKILMNIEKKCPTLFKLFTEYGDVFSFTYDGMTGICKEIELSSPPTLKLVTDEKVLETAKELMIYSIDLYYEIHDNCPLKDWVRRLEKL